MGIIIIVQNWIVRKLQSSFLLNSNRQLRTSGIFRPSSLPISNSEVLKVRWFVSGVLPRLYAHCRPKGCRLFLYKSTALQLERAELVSRLLSGRGQLRFAKRFFFSILKFWNSSWKDCKRYRLVYIIRKLFIFFNPVWQGVQILRRRVGKMYTRVTNRSVDLWHACNGR